MKKSRALVAIAAAGALSLTAAACGDDDDVPAGSDAPDIGAVTDPGAAVVTDALTEDT